MTFSFRVLKSSCLEYNPEVNDACMKIIKPGKYLLGTNDAAYCSTGHCVGGAKELDFMLLIIRSNGLSPEDEFSVTFSSCIPSWLTFSLSGPDADSDYLQPANACRRVNTGQLPSAERTHTTDLQLAGWPYMPFRQADTELMIVRKKRAVPDESC